MRLRAVITIELDAADFQGAAEHEQAVLALYELVRAKYVDARFQFAQRRERTPKQAPLRPGVLRPSGRMHEYADEPS